jgi:hypothetical protein
MIPPIDTVNWPSWVARLANADSLFCNGCFCTGCTAFQHHQTRVPVLQRDERTIQVA